MNTKRVLTSTFIILVAIFVWRTDTFQKTAFPKRYWEQKVNTLESKVIISQCLLIEHMMALQNKQDTARPDFLKHYIDLKKRDLSNEEAGMLAWKIVQETIKASAMLIPILSENIEEDQTELEKSRVELAKYEEKTIGGTRKGSSLPCLPLFVFRRI